MPAANLSEVFCSIQGEGLFAGLRQLFIRFAGCNLECAYCDTPASREISAFALFETPALSGSFEKQKNPVSLRFLLRYIDRYVSSSVHSISLTGGEPLLHDAFLKDFLLSLNLIRPVCLETNGSLPEELSRVIGMVDFVSMDMKTACFGDARFRRIQAEFLRIAAVKPVQVKVIVNPGTPLRHFRQALKIVAAVDTSIPLIIQPETGNMPGQKQIFKMHSIALNELTDVRVIPQMHPLLHIR